MNKPKEKVVVITGASSGIGEATARRLAKDGATVALVARRKDRLEEIAKDIAANGGTASCHEVDVTQKKQVAEMIDAVVQKYGRLDVLVSNAGLMALSPISSGKVVEWDQMIDLNIKGILYGVAVVWPIFEKQNSGHFINIASIAGLKVAPGNVVYCATKHAVRALSEGIRMEAAGRFRVTTISPGYVESELKYGTSDEATRNSVVEAYQQNAIPAESIGNAIAYAISQPEDTAINEVVIRPTVQEF
jgi:NADP-dependent 3-hydroxy acid dehydrogenase YdfG